MPPPLPAHKTKHHKTLTYPLPNTQHTLTLHQSQSQSHPDRATTGTTLWLGAQLLTCYLQTLHPPTHTPGAPGRNGKRAIDLGAGTGLTSLYLAYAGFDVLATDLPVVIDAVLTRNVVQNADALRGRGQVRVRELDWTSFSPSDWEGEEGVDLIVTADTVYDAGLVAPLVGTIRGLCERFGRKGGSVGARKRYPLVLVALEVRDREVVDFALEEAGREGFECRRVGDGKVRRCLGAAGVEWAKEEWGGVQIWRLVFRG